MPKSLRTIPSAPCSRILENSGAKRVSKEAAEKMADLLEEYGQKISKKALMIAKHSGRKTVQANDIKLALK